MELRCLFDTPNFLVSMGYLSLTSGKIKHLHGGWRTQKSLSCTKSQRRLARRVILVSWNQCQPGKGRPLATEPSPTLTDSGLVTMTEVLWKTLTLTTGPYFLALGTKVTVNSPKCDSPHPLLCRCPLSGTADTSHSKRPSSVDTRTSGAQEAWAGE